MATQRKIPTIHKLKRVEYKEDGVTKVRYDPVKVKPSEIKQTIMQANNWTADQYRKQYDIFKNKLRAYESYRKAHGAKVKEQSPLEVLYAQAKAKIREGSAYTPSMEMQRIQSFSAVSITKGRKLAAQLESGYSKSRAAQFEAITNRAFENFIKETPKAQEIVYGIPLTEDSDPTLIKVMTEGSKEIEIVNVVINATAYKQIFADGRPLWESRPVTDPVKREEALKALADHIHAKQLPNGEAMRGEEVGSDPAGEDFDYDAWLD